MNVSMDCSFTFGMANAGAVGKSMGAIAASANPRTLARGLTFNLSAACDVIRTRAAAPSFKVLALAAVTVPVSKKVQF